MSRLGEQITMDRTRKGMSRKQVAKLCGVSERYLEEVESGRRVINDQTAMRILKVIGATAAPLQEEIMTQEMPDLAGTRTVHAEPVPARLPPLRQDKPQAAASGPISETWAEAMKSVMRPVPLIAADGKTVDSRMLPVSRGMIEGYPADTLCYFLAPDDSMSGLRIQRGDWVLIAPTREVADNSVMLILLNHRRMLRRVRKRVGNKLLLESCESVSEQLIREKTEVQILGLAVRVEFPLKG